MVSWLESEELKRGHLFSDSAYQGDGHNVVTTALSELILTHNSPLATSSLNFGEVNDCQSGASKRTRLELFSSNLKTNSAKIPSSTLQNQRTRGENGNSDNFSW